LDKSLIDHVVAIFEKEGSDAWFQRPVEELTPSGFKCPRCGGNNFRKESDILDVWFDSGSSHEAVLGKRADVPWPADVYIEGGDQYRGWFHSSLLVGMGTRDAAPYRQVLTHGFTLDAEGKAMSKSLGNVIEPQSIVNSHGAEILRLWVASSDFKEDVRISKDMITRLSDAYRKFRNTAKFILGNLYDFEPSRDALPAEALTEVDQWALMRTHQLLRKMYQAYEGYEFHKLYHACNEFVTVDLSAFYFDILKDRLYISAPDSRIRRSSQTAMFRVLEALILALAPIYSFTCDEIWQYLPRDENRPSSVHLAYFVSSDRLVEGLSPETLKQLANWDRLISVRAAVLKVLEVARKDKFIGTSLEAKVKLTSKAEIADLIGQYREFLPALFIVSQVETTDQIGSETYFLEAENLKVAVVRADGEKCERCWNYSVDVGKDSQFPSVCPRCAGILREIGWKSA
jgi:isoleucyl-tRNA synthetase